VARHLAVSALSAARRAQGEVRVALVGYGYAGQTFHLPLLTHVAGLRVTHVVSSKTKLRLAGTCVTPAVEQVFGDPQVDLVVIATPNESHFPLAQRALLAGKNVVVDKPFTTTVAEAQELIALAKKARLLLSVFHNRRWDADFLTVRQLFRKNLLGEVMHFESHFDRFRPQVQNRWRERAGPGSGVWFDLGSHLADQALQLFGAPDYIHADLAVQRPGAATTDYFHVVMEYNVSRVILHASSLVAAETARFKLHGTCGSYIKYGLDTQEEALKRGKVPGSAGWGRDARRGTLYAARRESIRSKLVPQLPGNYLRYYEAVRDALLEGKPNPVPAEEALQVMQVLETGEESARLGNKLKFNFAEQV
jgi:scyllo-inositol 2-dehydrogenase (NADP+)